MPKKTIIPKSLNQIKELENYVDAFIIPIENFSINYEKTFKINEVKTNKEIFFSLNKNFHNNELKDLEEILKQIDNLNIKGILFYDLALVNIHKRLNLKTDLFYAQEHLSTNYGIINYWYKKGVKYAYLSSELTKREIDEIRENTLSKLFVNVFGYIPMFTSQRHLVKNYLETFNIKDENKQKVLEKENKKYIITDKKDGTTVYSDYILNSTKENFDKIDYLVFNSNFIEEETFNDIIMNKKEIEENTGFLYNETIYKVK